MSAYRCKVVKRDGHVVDGCGFEFTPTLDGPVTFVDAACPLCKVGFLRTTTRPTPWPGGRSSGPISNQGAPYITTVEVCPGVHVSPDGSARGPGLETALATAADVAVLNAHGPWSMHDGMCHLYNSVQTFDAGTPTAAMRAAADAIRNGRVPT